MATSTLGSGTLVLAGTTSGTTTVTATAVAGTTTLTLPAATDTLVGKATTDTLTNKTLGAVTLGGTVAGGGNQINNVIIGATSPLAGSFTTGTFTPSGITQPINIGQHSGAPSYGVVSLNGSMSTTGVTGLAGGGGGDNNLYLKAPTGYSVLGSINNSTVTTTSSTGLAVTGLVDISAATSGQIKFPATQNASSNANTLDDYEEGTFTPTLAFGGGSTGLTYSANSGTYTKIGRLVTGRFIIGLSNKGSSSGSAVISGLPFTVNASDLGSAVVELALNFNVAMVSSGFCGDNSTTISLFTWGPTGMSAATDVNFANNTRLDMWFQYFV